MYVSPFGKATVKHYLLFATKGLTVSLARSRFQGPPAPIVTSRCLYYNV